MGTQQTYMHTHSTNRLQKTSTNMKKTNKPTKYLIYTKQAMVTGTLDTKAVNCAALK